MVLGTAAGRHNECLIFRKNYSNSRYKHLGSFVYINTFLLQSHTSLSFSFFLLFRINKILFTNIFTLILITLILRAHSFKLYVWICGDFVWLCFQIIINSFSSVCMFEFTLGYNVITNLTNPSQFYLISYKTFIDENINQLYVSVSC